jgi:hypothetical protein
MVKSRKYAAILVDIFPFQTVAVGGNYVNKSVLSLRR